MGKIDRLHAEKVKFKAGDNGTDRRVKNAVRFRNRFHAELRTVSAELSDEYHGVVKFPIYGAAGLRAMEGLRDAARRLYGRADVTALIKAFYEIMARAETREMATAAVEFDIHGGKYQDEKVEKTWEVAR